MSLLMALVLGCSEPIQDIEVQVLDKMPTLARVTWSTKKEVASQVRFGPGTTLSLTTPLDSPSTEHSALLLGLPPSTIGSFQVVADDDESEMMEVETGELDEVFPGFILEGEELGQFMLTPLYAPEGDDGPVILDGAGRTVWQYADQRGLYVTRVQLARDGSGLIYNSSDLNGHHDETQELVWVSWEGEEIRTEEVELLGHDFVEKEDGTIVTVAFDDRGDVVGTKLVEIAPDGTQTDTWSSWDCFDPNVDTHDEMEMGWTFANAMDYDEEDNVYTISFRNFGSIVSVDGDSGECEWVLGDVAGTIDIAGGTFKHQHQFVRTNDTMLIFDNDGQPGQSRIIEYDFDATAGTATEAWSYSFDSWNVVLGDVHRLANGDTLAVWGMHGEMERITPGKEVTTSLATDELGTVIGFTTLLDDLYAK
ncbi:MAG: hypothetical protein HN348_04560 [Proteobacteria bacterium]|nr:hypothetical protein [Pseudomonadota bacterium]